MLDRFRRIERRRGSRAFILEELLRDIDIELVRGMMSSSRLGVRDDEGLYRARSSLLSYAGLEESMLRKRWRDIITEPRSKQDTSIYCDGCQC